jgi:hypothetical protein
MAPGIASASANAIVFADILFIVFIILFLLVNRPVRTIDELRLAHSHPVLQRLRLQPFDGQRIHRFGEGPAKSAEQTIMNTDLAILSS